jgi:hypothetical protein
MSDYGLKWAKDGVAVETAEIHELIINSSNPMLKIKEIGTGTINYTHDGAPTDVLVADHDLDYEPIFIVYTQWFNIDTDSKETTYRQAPFIDSLVGGSVYFVAKPYVNDTELRYTVNSFTGSGSESVSLKYLYIIYYDPDES